jgi:hypothetical protein
MREPYQDIYNWSAEQLDNELKALYTDKDSGIMSDMLYEECFDIVYGELLKRLNAKDTDGAYDRAMKGI